ncbi:hypothetical protein TNCV_536601 [Trichonephila clavipes]|nr:hypothetical protein TNCV_536601 [Trichonephila clavipes]
MPHGPAYGCKTILCTRQDFRNLYVVFILCLKNHPFPLAKQTPRVVAKRERLTSSTLLFSERTPEIDDVDAPAALNGQRPSSNTSVSHFGDHCYRVPVISYIMPTNQII